MIKPFLLLLLGCFAATAQADTPASSGENQRASAMEFLTIGTYTRHPEGGLYGARFDSRTGEFGPVRTLAATPNPSFLAASPDGRFLYATNEWGQIAGENKGGLSAFRLESTSTLAALNAVSSGGNGCHLSVDATGKWLLVAAYSGGTVSTWPISADGTIGPRAFEVQHMGRGLSEKRQTEPHPHQVVLSRDNTRAFVADLGIDKVMMYDFDDKTGALVPSATPFLPLASGAGPRHLTFSSSGQLYVVGELDNTVTVFKNPRSPGTPQVVQVISTLPADFVGQSSAAEIALRPDGRFLYVSNRGFNSIACYAVANDGRLKLAGFFATGSNPRHFTFDASGKWLLVAAQSDRSVTAFEVDEQSGALSAKHQVQVPDEPVCLLLSR